MTTYREGQRVRIEIEGTLRDDGPNCLRVCWDEDASAFGATFAVNGRPVSWVQRSIVTVLAEPRPDEPTGLGAVVEARLGTAAGQSWLFVRVEPDAGDYAWRVVDPKAALGNSFYMWGTLIDPVIKDEGWTP